MSYPFLRRSGPIETILRRNIRHGQLLSIHFCEEVAQLKLFVLHCCLHNTPRYPFLRRSGPIETNYIRHINDAQSVYPFLRRSGPIETSGKHHMQLDLVLYPFLRRSGPIETVSVRILCLSSFGPIHFCEEVAQLKLGLSTATKLPLASYPFLRRSGPIETPFSA